MRFRHITTRQAALAIALWTIASIALDRSPAREAIDRHASRRLAHAFRSAVGRDPVLDPRIKIFLYDDLTVARLGQTDVSPSDWSLALQALAARGAASILIDKLFDQPRAAPPHDFAAVVGALPVTSGVFASSEEIRGRRAFAPAWPQFAQALDAAWMPVETRYAYGADPALAEGFPRSGHLAYEHGGRTRPFLRVRGQDGRDAAVPHAAFAAAEIRVDGNDLTVNGTVVPLDRDGFIHADVAPPDSYLPRTYSFLPVITRSRAGRPIDVVQPGDVVVILPSMFTGHSDWVETPAGTMAGGFFLTALANSALTGTWIRPVDGYGAVALLATLTGALAGLLLNGQRFWAALGAGALAASLAGPAAFALFNVETPWLTFFASMLGPALTLYAIRTLNVQLDQARMEIELATARLVQESFLPPKEAPADDAVTIAVHYTPMTECCGDWWSRWTDGGGCTWIAIGDAMGHGVPAALVTGLAYATIRTTLSAGTATPHELLQRVNSVLVEAFQGTFTMSMTILAIDPDGARLSYANAAHPQPMIRPRDAGDERLPPMRGSKRPRVITLRDSADILGAGIGVVYETQDFELRDGDQIVLYSDGATDAAGHARSIRTKGRKAGPGTFGRAALLDALGGDDARDEGATLAALVKATADGLEGTLAQDDVTIVVARVTSPAVALKQPV